MKWMLSCLLLVCLLPFTKAQIYGSNECQVEFTSEAPLELIQAFSNQLRGVLDTENKTFAFQVYIKSFEGFNNPVQRTHFYENYMDVSEHPEATFKGKIIEDVTVASAQIRAKGILNIHGVSIERIIPVFLSVGEKNIEFKAIFEVPLKDHEIALPRIVQQKVAEEIQVKVSGTLSIRK